MKPLAAGDLGAEVPFAGRKDEIGEMTRAVGVFNQNEIAVHEPKARLASKERADH